MKDNGKMMLKRGKVKRCGKMVQSTKELTKKAVRMGMVFTRGLMGARLKATG